MLALAALADAVGLFDVAAQGALRRSRGSTRRLFWLLAVVSAVGTALLSLDAVAMALTPVVLVVAARARPDAEPFLFGSIAVANAASVALPVSNPDVAACGWPGPPPPHLRDLARRWRPADRVLRAAVPGAASNHACRPRAH